MSVREMRRLELDDVGRRPPEYDGGGNGRAVAAFRNKATVGNRKEIRYKSKKAADKLIIIAQMWHLTATDKRRCHMIISYS
jgi:hypothetical protein